MEVKNYTRRHVPLEDFTAVTDNLRQNIAISRRAARPRLRLHPSLKSLKAEHPAQFKALREKVAVPIEPGRPPGDPAGPTTLLGGDVQKGRKNAVLALLNRIFRGRVRRAPRLTAEEIEVARQVDALELADTTSATRLRARHAV